jgi:hypothetical protein
MAAPFGKDVDKTKLVRGCVGVQQKDEVHTKSAYRGWP